MSNKANKAVQITTVFVLLFFLNACMLTPNYGCDDIKPLTPKEKEFFANLKKLGLKIEHLPENDYGYRYWYNDEYPCEYSTDYFVFIENVPNSWYEDTVQIKKFAADLVVDLYSNVLEDSVRCFLDSYEISLISKENDSLTNYNRNYSIEIKQNQIENFVGYKIIMTESGLKKVDVDQSDLEYESEELK